MSKKIVLMILLLISCSIGMIAQTSYYYYREKKVPLTVNKNKVCMSIPKNRSKISKEILKNVKVIDKIKDDDFDIYIIQQSDLDRVSASYSMKDVLLSPCYRTMEGSDVYPTPYLNVRLKREQDVNLLSSCAERYGLNIIKKDSLLPLWYILSITSETGKNALESANALWRSGLFAASVPDLCSSELTCSDDPMFNLQWGLHNSDYTGIDISICPAWNYATGKNIKIAIIDDGVDLDHIDLTSNIGLSYDTETNSSPSVLYGDHGTHCAGIAAAVKDNSIQIAGVAPEATIVSIRNSFGYGTNTLLKLAGGFVWAVQSGVDVISNSWISSAHPAIDEAIEMAFRYGRHGKGCVIVFAVGNDSSSTIKYPANSNDMILAVGAIDSTGTRAGFSNYGEGLDVVAPGVNILSTVLNDTVGYMSGTSMACAHVAGVAALILERNSELSVAQVNSIINSNAKKLFGVNFNISKPDGWWNNEYGYGLVDAYNSVINTPNVAYIQNDSITGYRTISAENIYVGRDVTNGKPYGDVILGQGYVTLKAKNVEIKNSTTVPLGTMFTIEN